MSENYEIQALFSRAEEIIPVSGEALFDGYTELKILTFSYGMDFIQKITRKFEKVEVVFGQEALVRNDVKEIMAQVMAYQQHAVLEIYRRRELAERAVKGEIKFFIMREIPNHAKLFILKNGENGHTRVIAGSANASSRAFKGYQNEIFIVYDNDDIAMRMAENEFHTAKDFSKSDEVVLKTQYIQDVRKLKELEKDFPVDELPVAKTIVTKNMDIIIEMPENRQAEKWDGLQLTSTLSVEREEYKKVLPTFQKKGSHVTLTSTDIKLIKKRQTAVKQEEKAKNVAFPSIRIDYENESCTLLGHLLDLNPKSKDINEEVTALIRYFRGFEQFLNFRPTDLDKYFKVLNYMLLAPFNAEIRIQDHRHSFGDEIYPFVLFLNGPKSAGKTAFVNMVHCLMTGHKVPSCPTDRWAKTKIREYLLRADGFPLHLNDLSKERHRRNSEEIIKDYQEELLENNMNRHTSFIITCNGISSLKPHIAKRSFYLDLGLYLRDADALKLNKSTNDLLKKFKGALYGEYIRRMIPLVKDLFNQMAVYSPTENEEPWIPDFYQLSSQVLTDIVTEYIPDCPGFIRPLTYESYAGLEARTEKVKEELLICWEKNPGAFQINRKKNEWVFDAGQDYSANSIADQLSEAFAVTVSKNKVIAKLDAAENFFERRFKKKLFRK